MYDNIYVAKNVPVPTKDGVSISTQKSKVELLPASAWGELSYNELIDQKALLYEKWEWLANNNNALKQDFATYLMNISDLIDSRN